MSIKLKLTFVAVSVVLIVLTIGALASYVIKRVIKIEELTSNIHTFETDVLLLRNYGKDLLMSVRNNDDFYITKRSLKIDDIYELHRKMTEREKTISTNNQKIYGEVLINSDTIHTKLKMYKVSFDLMIENLYEIGNKTHGTIGEIYNTNNEIEKIISEQFDAQMQLDYYFLNNKIHELIGNANSQSISLYMNHFDLFIQNIESVNNSKSDHVLLLLNNQNQLIEKYINQTKDFSINIRKNISAIKDLAIISKNISFKNEIESKAEIQFALRRVLFFVIFISIGIIITSFYVSLTITNPIERIKNYVDELAQGKLPEPLNLQNRDEITEIANNLNQYIDNLREKSEFAKNIGSGNFTTHYKPISEADQLGISLLEMRDSLKKAREDEMKLKEQEKIRNWMSDGIAKFSQLLSIKTDNLQELCDEILFNLIHYISANQGGIFITKQDKEKADEYLELVSMYAFDRKKAMKKRIEIGEGLVGLCAKEKQTNYLDEIPAEYAEIGSAFGYSPPRTLLLTPMVVENRTFGVIELASIQTIKKHHIELVKIIAENFASVLWRIKLDA